KDTLFAIDNDFYKEAEKQGNFKYCSSILANKLFVYYNRREYDEVIDNTPEYLQFMEQHNEWRTYFQAYDISIKAYIGKGNLEAAIVEAKKMYDKAAKMNDDGSRGTALFSMAMVYKAQNRNDEFEKCLRQCIDIIQDLDPLLNLLTSAWYNLCQTLMTQERYEEALVAANELEKVNYRYEAKPGVSAQSAWANLWGIYTRLYTKLGDYENAEMYCDKLDNLSNNFAHKITVNNARAQIYNAQGKYDEALESINKSLEIMGDSYTSEANAARGIKMLILSNLGHAKELYQLAETSAAVHDSIRNTEYANQIDDLRTQYEVDKHIAEKERTRNLLIFAITICVILISGLLIVLVLYRQKQRAYKQLVRKSQQWAGVPEIELQEETEQTEEPDENSEVIQDVGSLPDSTDISIMEGVVRLMDEKKIYLEPDISLDSLSNELGIDRRYISAAINKCTNKNFYTYINEFRIKEAVRIMSEPSYNNLSIDGIAFESGFSDRKTFHRVFKQNTGVTPGVFKRESAKA
ncbi:helix-turn-helix domain-containing protein, partial [Bacteroidales bacterium OttesenSCG-928-K22]|nr:helix-turn-helix domain-containing protein [Bacteroidales bacterium OttesenSCG-928-K22]